MSSNIIIPDKEDIKDTSRRLIYTSKYALKRSLLQAGMYAATIQLLDSTGILKEFLPPLESSAPAAVFGALSGGFLGVVTGTVDATTRYNELKRILQDPRIPNKDKKLIRTELLGEKVKITKKDMLGLQENTDINILDDINNLID